MVYLKVFQLIRKNKISKTAIKNVTYILHAMFIVRVRFKIASNYVIDLINMKSKSRDPLGSDITISLVPARTKYLVSQGDKAFLAALPRLRQTILQVCVTLIDLNP